MPKKENEKLVPNLRFKGFTDDWIQEKLSSKANFAKGKGYKKSDLVSTGYPILLYGELYTNYRESITSAITFVADDRNSIKSNGREVVVPSSGESAEDIARASSINMTNLILGGDLNIIYPDKSINNVFLALLLSNGIVKKELAKKAQGTSITHLYNTDLKDVVFYYPIIDEQLRISESINRLSKIIALEQEKHELLISYKKYIIQNIFNDNNLTSLKEVATITTGKLNANAMDPDGIYDFYTSGINTYTINEYAFEGPAITIAGNGATVGFMHMANGKFNAYQRTYVLQNFKINIEYLFYNIQKELPRKIHEESRTGSIPYIVMDMLEDLPIYLDDVKIMNKIGKKLELIDKIMEKSFLRIEKIKKIRKYLLDNLFV